MPVQHSIDHSTKIITTTWSGEAADIELIEALLKYQQNIKNQSEFCSFSEIVDFRTVSVFKLSPEGLLRLAQIAAGTDVPGVKTKLAIVVSKPVAFGFGRMYEAYRSLIPHIGGKEVRVFKDINDALEWIERNSDESTW